MRPDPRTQGRPARWAVAVVIVALCAVAVVGPVRVGGAEPTEVVVAGPLDSGEYFFGGPQSLTGPIDELVFSVYATEIDRAPDGAIWVRDYLSIVRIAPDLQTYRRVVGLTDYADLDDPSIGTPLMNVGLDPSVVSTQLRWDGGRRMAVDAQGALVFVDRNSVFRLGSDGVIEHLGGTGVEGSAGDGGPAVDADMSPTLLQVDAAGNVWFVEIDGTSLRKISTDGMISTEAIEPSGITDFAISPDGDVALLVPAANELFQSLLQVSIIDGSSGDVTTVALDDDQFCLPEFGGGSSQSQFTPTLSGDLLEFVGAAEVGPDTSWSSCSVDLSTGATERTGLGIDPTVDRRSNIELGDGSVWYMRYDTEEPTLSGLVRLGAPQPVPRVSVGDQSGLERDVVTGSVFVPVTLSEPAAEPVVVSFFTQDGSAVAGADYSRWGTPSNPRSVTIPAGALQTTINVPVLADSVVEGDETFSVVLSSVSGGGAVTGDGTGTSTIVDADGVSGVDPAITVSSGSVVEGDGGRRRVQFQVHLSRAPSSNVTISYNTADGSAAAPGDYVAKLPGSVVFAPGQISKTIDVLVNSNIAVNGDREFSLEVSVTGGSPVEELNMVGVARIVDDD